MPGARQSSHSLFAGSSARALQLLGLSSFAVAARLGLDRSEMARRLGVSELSDMGFRFELPAEAAAEESALSLRLFAISPRKVASEISIATKAGGGQEIEGRSIEYTEPQGTEGAL